MTQRTILALTLIITLFLSPTISFSQQPDFPYKLKKTDFMLLGLGLSSELCAIYMENNQHLITYDELINLDRGDINGFDRGATYNWSKNLNENSDWTRAFLIVSPSILILNEGIQKEWKNFFTLGTMYAEVALVTVGLTNLTKSIVMRERPYFYNTNINLTEKQEMINDNDVSDSFFSGHTSSAFASAVFLSKTYTDIYGKNTLSKVIWGTSLTVASITGYLRYKSGYHYPTDIIAGALVGSAIGYFVPVLHKQKSKTKNISLNLNSNYMCLTYTFK